MTTETIRAGRVAPAAALRHTAVITKRNLLRNVRLPQLLVVATIQPVMFLVLFTYVFGGAVGVTIPAAADGKYINWLIPGLLVQVATFGASQTALGLTEDLTKGVIDRFRSLPIARSAVLAGRTISDLLRNAFVMSLMLAIGFLIGFRIQTNVFALVAALAVALVFTFAVSWVMATIGLIVKNPEATQSAVFLPIFPLVFASSIFVPTITMPSWLRGFAENQPITVTANALRGLMLGEGALPEGTSVESQILLALVWAAAIVAVFGPLAVRLYRRTVS